MKERRSCGRRVAPRSSAGGGVLSAHLEAMVGFARRHEHNLAGSSPQQNQ
jgi:hypothetical protein